MSILSLFPDRDMEIVAEIRRSKIEGAHAVDIVRKLSQRGIGSALRMAYFATAFEVAFPSVQMAALWNPNDTSESRERETNEVLEQAILHGSFAAKYLVPQELVEEIGKHQVWLETDSREGSQLRRANGSAFYWLNLSGRDLSRCELPGVNFDSVVLMKCDLRNANFENSIFSNVEMAESKISNANFDHSRLYDCGFDEADVSCAVFREATIHKASFREAHAISADFSDCELTEVDFSGCDLTRSKFDRAVLANCSFENATLAFTSLNGARLIDTTLNRALG